MITLLAAAALVYPPTGGVEQYGGQIGIATYRNAEAGSCAYFSDVNQCKVLVLHEGPMQMHVSTDGCWVKVRHKNDVLAPTCHVIVTNHFPKMSFETTIGEVDE